MLLTEPERKARKEAQIARLALKGTPGYSKAYESQPEQIRLRAKEQARRKAERDEKRAAAIQAAQDAQEAAEVFKKAGSLTADLGAEK